MKAVSNINPVVTRRRLRAELRSVRLEAGFTQEEVAEAMDWSRSKVIRIEAGSVGVSTNDLRALLHLYKMNDATRTTELVDLAKQARERAWWTAFREIMSPQYLQFMALEAAASVSRGFEPLLVPGLLQTYEYARIVIEQLGGESLPLERLDALVSVRMKRQELLARADPPHLVFVLDEAVIRRLVGGAAVMRRQIQHIVEIADRPTVTVQVLPFNAGAHRGMKGPFVIFEFPGTEDDDVLYLENSRGDLIIRDDTDDVAAHEETFRQLTKLSLGPQDSITHLERVASEMN